MQAISLKAHFDGTNIQLDEPHELKPGTQLLVTVLPPSFNDSLRGDWERLALERLSQAYGDDEPEYTEADLRS